MTATLETARDEILTVFRDVWTPTGWTALYQDTPEVKPSAASPFARATVRYNGAGQGSLARHDGQNRWNRTGVLTVQVFTPVGEGLSRSDDLVKIVLDAFEGTTTPSGVWFRNARPRDVGPTKDWYQVNVLVDFEHDEFH